MARDELSTQLVVEGSSERFVLDEALIEVQRGPNRGASLTLEPAPLRIGSAPECDLVLEDPTVSRYHVEVFPSKDGYVLRDLGSRNKIRLGRWRVETVLLERRMRFQLGATSLLVRCTSEQISLLLHQAGELGQLVVHSVPMRALAEQLRQLGPTDLPVLIEGETGSGKEATARTLHELSDRSGPFVVADLGAMPATLLASELFGHERGAFTGADSARPGLFEEAEGGTLFLDELGEFALELQPQLLRVLDRRTSRRVGGNRDRKHDVRLIAATQRNLREEVRRGRFREDLYYRLASARLRVPPLRARPEDLPHLAHQFAEEAGCPLSAEVVRVMLGYHWPGNVRELRNAIERMAAMPEGHCMPLDEAFEQREETDEQRIVPLPLARRDAIDTFERGYLAQVMQAAQGSVPDAARLAGVSHSMLSRMLRRHRGSTE
jgi:two-component system response regulator GlrR